METMTARPPTSSDVARLAGVSQATVSYVLNDRADSRVTEETRAKVLSAAEKLGYVRHAGARSLKTGNSGLVLLPLTDVPFGPLATRFIEDLDHELTALGYTMITYGARQARGMAAARAWAELRPAAIIVDTVKLTSASVGLLRKAGVKAVVGISPKPSTLVPTLVADQTEIGALAARHLRSQGRRELAVVVPREDGLRDIGLDRREGFGAGLQIDLAFDPASAQEILPLLRDVDGVFAYNDEYAMLLMSTLADAGIRVPDDIAIVGADDLPLARLLRPQLTTVALDISGTAAAVVAFLTSLIDGTPATPPRLWTTHLIKRSST